MWLLAFPSVDGTAQESTIGGRWRSEPPYRFVLTHLGGLSAGPRFGLGQGTQTFGPGPHEHGDPSVAFFDLTIPPGHDRGGQVVVSPAKDLPEAFLDRCRLDHVSLTGTERFEPGQVLTVGPDQFLLESPAPADVDRPAPRARPAIPARPQPPMLPSRTWLLAGTVPLVGAALVLLLVDRRFWILAALALCAAAALWFGYRRVRTRRVEQWRMARQRRVDDFTRSLQSANRAEAAERRKGVGLPSEVIASATHGSLLTLTSPHTIAIGLTTDAAPTTWAPDELHHVDTDLRRVMTGNSMLTAVPITVDLSCTVIGLSGPRAATLAVARHLLTANLLSSEPLGVHLDVADSPDWTAFDLDDRPAGDLFYVTDRLDLPARFVRAGLVVADTDDQLPSFATARVRLDDAGYASLEDEAGRVVIDRFVPLGITDAQTRSVLHNRIRVPPLDSATIDPEHRATEKPSTGAGDDGAIVVISSDRRTNDAVLASLAVDLLRRPDRTRLSVFVLDGTSRGLIRLAQLDHTQDYAAADDPVGVERVLRAVEHTIGAGTRPAPPPVTAVLLTSDIDGLISFLDRAGRGDLIGRLLHIVDTHDRIHLMMAASQRTETALAPPFGDRFATRLHCRGDIGVLESVSATRTISLTAISGRDLTGAVADLRGRRTRPQNCSGRSVGNNTTSRMV